MFDLCFFLREGTGIGYFLFVGSCLFGISNI